MELDAQFAKNIQLYIDILGYVHKFDRDCTATYVCNCRLIEISTGSSIMCLKHRFYTRMRILGACCCGKLDS